MQKPTRIIPLVLIGLVAALTLTAGGGDKAAKVWAADEVKWTANPAMPGMSIAPLWGDPSKGAYGALKKVAGGTAFGWHTHSNAQKVVAVSGTIEFTLEGGTMKE
ncbi:MAG: hypothetical protein M3547_02935, partial [Acidobacteriota bacterium]|nr:hypothetical protein [Acidobacteriota bacterium]